MHTSFKTSGSYAYETLAKRVSDRCYVHTQGRIKLKVLGRSGEIGGRLRSAACLIDEDILVEGGTGLVYLGLAAFTRINHVLVTHRI